MKQLLLLSIFMTIVVLLNVIPLKMDQVYICSRRMIERVHVYIIQ